MTKHTTATDFKVYRPRLFLCRWSFWLWLESTLQLNFMWWLWYFMWVVVVFFMVVAQNDNTLIWQLTLRLVHIHHIKNPLKNTPGS